MLYLIAYDLKTPARDYAALYQTIKSFETWWHYLESTWIVKTARNLDDVVELLHKQIDSNDRLFVVDISQSKRNGWLPRKAWDWLRRQDDADE